MNPAGSIKSIPAGSKALLPDQAARKRRMERRLLEVFARWGFREIVTPVFEHYLPTPGGESRDAQTFRLVDRDTGGLLALRSDLTPQIARLAGSLLASEPRPLRLSYVANVFRHAHVAGLLQQEFWQAGVELIGLVSLEADVEMIAIAVECLSAVGLENFRISLSHGAFLGGLLGRLRVEGSERGRLLDAIARRDTSGLEEMLRVVAARGAETRALALLPELFGGAEVLARARELVRNPASRRALRELGDVHRMLSMYGLAERVVFDLGDLRDVDYYTGVFFEGFVEGSGYPVCGGGRYDRLLGLYGTDALGTGFALDLEQLMQIAADDEEEERGTDFLVIDFTREKRVGISLSRELRALGWRVARDIIRRDLGESLRFARRAGIRRCIVVDRQGAKARRVRMLDASGRELGQYAIAELAGQLGRREEVS